MKKPPVKKAPAAMSAPRPGVPRVPGKRRWLLDVPFDDRMTAKWGGARFDPASKAWVFDGDALPPALASFAARPHSWPRWLEDDVNGFQFPTLPRSTSITLHPHQEVAVEQIVAAHRAGWPGFLLADDVGLGKTPATVAAVDALGVGLNVLVLAPLSVVPHWRRQIDAGSTGMNRWCVINYDRAKQLLEAPESAQSAKRTRTRNKRHATRGRSKVRWDVVVIDEAHMLRNPTSQRAAAVRNLVGTQPGRPRTRPAFCIYLSATAGQDPLELSYLAPVLAHASGHPVKDLEAFADWCREMGIGVKKGAYGGFVWQRNDTDLETVRSLLFTGDPAPGLRRRPTDLAGWPEQVRVPFPVELDSRARGLYETAWDEFMALRTAALDDEGKIRGPLSANMLVALLRFRQKASLLRATATVDLVLDLLSNGHQVAVSVEFLETARELADQLARHKAASVTISGQVPAGEREQSRVEFQTGNVPVVLFTVCEGISLHAGELASSATDTTRSLVVHDPRWSAIQTAQIEGRTHRDGRNAVAYHCFAADTVEERVVAATLQRLTDMKAMIGDDVSPLEQLRDVLGLN